MGPVTDICLDNHLHILSIDTWHVREIFAHLIQRKEKVQISYNMQWTRKHDYLLPILQKSCICIMQHTLTFYAVYGYEVYQHRIQDTYRIWL